SLANAMADARTRETALITFLATAANVTLLGVGGAFWGLVAGLTAHLLIHGGSRALIANPAKPAQP
ncbi:MAG: benzoate/H(+) symporter BenE family transporter, partial [Achromobacter sp.]